MHDDGRQLIAIVHLSDSDDLKIEENVDKIFVISHLGERRTEICLTNMIL